VSANPHLPPQLDPVARMMDRLARIEARLASLERLNFESIVLDGPRSDLPALVGPRVRIGLLSDGSYGVERWSASGVRTTPTWS
jgi:hypothetical protein